MYPFLLLQVYTAADSDTFPSWLHHIGLVRMSCVLAGSLVDHMAVCSYLIWQISWVAVSFVFLLLACFLKYWVFCFVVYIPAPSISSITDWVVLFSFCCPFICADLISTAAMLLVPASLALTSSQTHSTFGSCCQRSTGEDIRLLVGCHLKETLHCCLVTSVVFSMSCAFNSAQLYSLEDLMALGCRSVYKPFKSKWQSMYLLLYVHS